MVQQKSDCISIVLVLFCAKKIYKSRKFTDSLIAAYKNNVDMVLIQQRSDT
jgi:hypothetical protein